MKIGIAKRGDEVGKNTFFLGWGELEERQSGCRCPSCDGYAEEAESTAEEIASDLNCGRNYACCCAAFECVKCGKRWIGKRPAPDMG